MQFTLIICGLDSVEARRWINATLVNMVDPENPQSLKPLIDGGTEGEYTSITLLIALIVCRLQGPSSCYPTHNHVVLRMLVGYAEQANPIPHLHHRQYPSLAGALYRMGFCPRMAPCLPRCDSYLLLP